MRHVYAILAHANPTQLARLIDSLLAPASEDRVVLHLDVASSLWKNGRGRFESHATGRLTLVDHPTRVIWGHASLVEAQRRLLRAALTQPFDYYHLISGSDWPIATRDRLNADIAARSPRRPVHIDLLENRQPARMDDWWFDSRKIVVPGWPRLTENAQRAQTRLSWSASRWAKAAGIRRQPFDRQPWLKGSGWFSVPYDAAVVLERETSRLLDSGRLTFTQCPDEHVAASILGRRFADRLEDGRRYIDWSSGGYHPKLLRHEDRPALERSGAWFARKVDATIDDFFYALPPF